MTNIQLGKVKRLFTANGLSLAFIAKKVGVPVGTYVVDFVAAISVTSGKVKQREHPPIETDFSTATASGPYRPARGAGRR
jgi:hypothetical protein